MLISALAKSAKTCTIIVCGIRKDQKQVGAIQEKKRIFIELKETIEKGKHGKEGRTCVILERFEKCLET